MRLRQDAWFADRSIPDSATPLRRSTIPALAGAWLKVEGAHPSGSFKERVMGVLVREAVDDGARAAVVASSGNAAVAAAGQCARLGLPLLVLVPRTVPDTILRMLALRHATVVVAGEGPAAVHGLAKRISARFQLPNLASTFGASGCEWACRGIGVEIADQLGSAVDVVAAAVSVGPVLLGAANGIAESTGSMPRMVAGQASGCAPIARAFQLGRSEVVEWDGLVDTRATSIADRLTGYANEASFFLRAVQEGDGFVGSAADARLRAIRDDLAAHDGLDVELSSCAAVAALIDSGRAGPDAVCILTGAGVRETLSAPVPDRVGSLGAFLEAAGASGDEQEVTSWIDECRS